MLIFVLIQWAYVRFTLQRNNEIQRHYTCILFVRLQPETIFRFPKPKPEPEPKPKLPELGRI